MREKTHERWKLTGPQRDYLLLLAGLGGSRGRNTWKRYRPAIRLVELGLAEWMPGGRVHDTYNFLTITKAGIEQAAREGEGKE